MTLARRTGATSLATLATCVAAFVLLHAVAPQWAQSAGLDFWAMSDVVALQKQEDQREERIEGQVEVLAQQIAAGESVATALIDDRIAFDAAVDQILEINSNRPGFMEALQSQYHPETAKRPLHERYLLEKVRHKLANDPSRLNEVMTRITCR